MLVGNLSQYFCEKNSLEKELSALRNSSNTEKINSKEEEIQTITRNAYLYGTGITIIAFVIVLNHAWTAFLGNILGMKHRILFIAAIYEKVHNSLYRFNCYMYVHTCIYVTFSYLRSKRFLVLQI